MELAGKILTVDCTDLAENTNGSVLLHYGETAVLVTVVMSSRESAADYFPLSVEFEEKFYAVGKMFGSRYQRREGRPSDEAILAARVIDRTIRPLFDQSIRRDVQVVVTVLALGEDDPDILGIIGASLALSLSDIPFAGPVAAVRIGRKKISGELLLNPSYSERAVGLLDAEILACGKDATINMIETTASELTEVEIVNLLEAAVLAHAAIETFQQQIITARGKKKIILSKVEIPAEIHTLFSNSYKEKLSQTLFSAQPGKEHLYNLKKDFLTEVSQAGHNEVVANAYFMQMIDDELHRGALEDNKRADGRGPDEVRPLYAQAGGISPALHGSGIFYRGGTHIFTALTLAGPEAAQLIESIESNEEKKRFIHHYNFPPYSVGETGRIGGFNRRMIGHGSLAEKALLPLIPDQTEFPYTIRLVSETLSSNGSSSMGSVCAATLALMDGGVPLKRPVAGIASGVLIGPTGSYVLLTDIQGPEDEFGDMDFKVAGTKDGITAIQMDVKVAGIPLLILTQALEKARIARLHILETITKELPAPRAHISPRAPEIIVINILKEQIGLVIGGGGKTINKIKDDTGVDEISIEEDGTVYVSGKNGTPALALEKIQALTKIYQTGEVYPVTITRLSPFGAFAQLDSYHEGLIHISEIAPFHLASMEGVLEVGEIVDVMVTKVDNGKIGLSIKRLNPDFATIRGLTATS